MLSLALPGRVFLCATPTDMRKSFDGLSAVVRDHLNQDPLAGDLCSMLIESHYDCHQGSLAPRFECLRGPKPRMS